MVIVDTTVWIDYFRGVGTPETRWLDAQMYRQRLGLTDVILCELLQGVRQDSEFSQIREELLKFEVFASGGRELAIQAAQHFRKLGKRGVSIGRMADCWIATFCMREGHALLHKDRDFDPFEKELGLQVIKP